MAELLQPTSEAGPGLPRPAHRRWQPLRGGLLNLYRYDAQEFRFEQGHLLLRGNNGTGKSRVLALQLPFLLDGEVAPSRLEPDGDPAKRIEWNLLLGKHADRLGYTWLEFGRRDEDGQHHYLTLGCGLSAVEGRGLVGRWFFVTPARIGEDLFLVSSAGRPLSRDGLREALGDAGELFTVARDYRRAVDAALFRLGEQRYEALVRLLIQLRKPQLSRSLKEVDLSRALSEALPPLSSQLVSEAAEAFRGLESDREALEGYRAAGRAVLDFLGAYRRYSQIEARRRAEGVRKQHARYESRQRLLRAAEEERRVARERRAALVERVEALAVRERETRQVIETLDDSPEMRSLRELERARSDAEERDARARRADAEADDATRAKEERDVEATEAEAMARTTWKLVQRSHDEALDVARAASLERSQQEVVALLGLPEVESESDVGAARQLVDEAIALQRRAAQRLHEWNEALRRSEESLARTQERQSDRDSQLARAMEEQQQAHRDLDAAVRGLAEDYRAWFGQLKELAPLDPDTLADRLEAWRAESDSPNPVSEAVSAAKTAAVAELSRLRSELRETRRRVEDQLDGLRAEHAEAEAGVHEAPPAPHTRDGDARTQKPGAPFWQLCDFEAGVSDERRAGLEAALEAAGLLDAWVSPEGEVTRAAEGDTVLVPDDGGTAAVLSANLSSVLVPCIDEGDPRACSVSAEVVQRLLERLGLGREAGPVWVDEHGGWQVGPLHGQWQKPAAQHLGQSAREAARRQRLARLAQAIRALELEVDSLERGDEALRDRLARAEREASTAPDARVVDRAAVKRDAAALQVDEARALLAEAEQAVAARREERDRLARTRDEGAADLGISDWTDRVRELEAAIAEYGRIVHGLWSEVRRHVQSRRASQQARRRAGEAREREQRSQERRSELYVQAREARARCGALEESIGAEGGEILKRLAEAKSLLQETQNARESARDEEADWRGKVQVAESHIATRGEELEAASEARAAAIARLERFAATELLEAAAPALVATAEKTDSQRTSVTAQVELARRIESLLEDVDSDDKTWERNKNEILRHIEQLKDALLPRGYEPETSLDDDLFLVRVPFQGKSRGSVELERALREEIGEREAILDAREREVIENHLIQDLATHLHERIRRAEEFVAGMNDEITSRPMSTGMSLRFAWRPLDDGPEGFKEARRSLLSAGETWSPEERQALGAFLQRQIGAEREANDTGTWQEHLEAALDYRAWHRFEVERRQEGKWTRLTQKTHGTGSGGEKAIALTIPQFAAAAAHYSSADERAPRLILLDEAFVGVDADMRGKCMDLLCRFDLDFVMTSEREWGCYATLNGVAIYQLATRPGIDAVGVTRWVWNGERLFRDEPAAAPLYAPLAEGAGPEGGDVGPGR